MGINTPSAPVGSKFGQEGPPGRLSAPESGRFAYYPPFPLWRFENGPEGILQGRGEWFTLTASGQATGQDVQTVPDYPLTEAARRLGTTTEALRARIKRRSVEGFRDNKGRWRVRLEDSRTGDGSVSGEAAGRLSERVHLPSGNDQTLGQMRERVAFLEGKLEGVELRLADRDRELSEVKTERAELLRLVGEANAALARRNQGLLEKLWDRLFKARG